MRPTDELMQEIVKASHPGALERPAFQNAPTLTEHLAHLMDQAGISRAEMGRRLLLERTHAYQLFAGIRVPTRRQLLCMALIMKLTVPQTQRFLKIAQRGALYPRKHFDALMLYALERGLDMEQASDLLEESGEKPLF